MEMTTTSETTEIYARAEESRLRLLADVTVRERRSKLAGIPTAFLEAGEGPPIVLLHGPGEFKERWYQVIQELATNHRVVAPDFPGHGRSGIPSAGLGTAEVFDWLDALLDECCEMPPVLVGHILGGSVAARYASVRPANQIERLVLVDSLGLARFRPSPRFAIGLARFMIRPTERTHEKFMHQCLADDQTVRDTIGEKWDALRDYSLDRAKDPKVKAAMKFFMSELGVPRIADSQLLEIKSPTSLVWGRDDRANRLRIAEAASERFGWPLHVIEGAADDPPMERPDEFVAAVLERDDG